MKWKAFKYLLPMVIYVGSWFSFRATGILVWIPLIYSFILIPVLELFITASNKNLDEAEETIARQDPIYDYFLYLIFPLQYMALFFFLQAMQAPEMNLADRIGHIMVMGLLCGSFGINVAHELGHRGSKAEQFLAKGLLLTSLYMHFFIEHNKGHHKNVATPADPSSARVGEPLYAFWFRSVAGVYAGAWRIANDDLRKKGLPAVHWKNEMLQFQLVQITCCTIIALVFGWAVLGYFLLAAAMGFLLLETVNYIEHYGLTRTASAAGKYERASPHHSWNSNHIIGRLTLFELSRHSDHHYLASRKYQVLRHHHDAPQLPTGYPGSMLMAAVPPLWFWVMDKRVKELLK
ncbi:MAG: alkane 1-monooxygenase [Chitinophagaceae bacterium]